MDQFKFKLGQVVKDVITLFEGVIMGRTEYLTGCNHYAICSKKLKEGVIQEWTWLDEQRLLATKKKDVELGAVAPKSRNVKGGPTQYAPSRRGNR